MTKPYFPPHILRRPLARAGISALVSLAIAQSRMAHAGCAPDASAGNDIIVCTATTSTPVDGGAGDDTITNQGTVTTDLSVTQNVPPPLPNLREFGSGNLDYEVDADRTAISGGAGNDTISNTGTVSSSSDATLLTITAPVTLSGGQTVTATNTVAATATGIAGNAGAGAITSSGLVQADATSTLTSANVEHNFADTTRGSVTTNIFATATGIAAADGDGALLTNSGQVNAIVSAASHNTNVEANLVDAAVMDASLNVDAEASALSAGAKSGTITNTGNLTVRSDAQSTDVSANLSYLDITLVDPKPAQGGTTVTAGGTGIDGTGALGALSMSNSAVIDVQTEAAGTAVAISLASEGTPQGLKPLISGLLDEKGLASVGLTTNGNATGMAGGHAADTLTNTNAVRISASSDAKQESINVGVSLIDWKIPTPGVVLGSAGTEAFANGLGIDGGEGDDHITNSAGASVQAHSDATAQAATVSANISGFTDNPLGGGSIPLLGSLGASVSVADTTTRAHASSSGLRGNDGSDTIVNDGTVSADADTSAGSVSVSASVNVKFGKEDNLLSANAVAARAITYGESIAIGIDGGPSEHRHDLVYTEQPALTSDNDVITNTGSVHADADTDVYAVAASITVAGPVKAAGATFNLAAADTSSVGYATAVGIDGGIGSDHVTNSGTIVANAQTDALDVTVGLQVAFANDGVAAGLTLARAEADADASATGINGGAQSDTLTNDQHVEAHADADARAIAISVSLSGTGDGVAISGSVADSSAHATATGSGIDGGTDNDMVRNTGVIDVGTITASALAASISASLAAVDNGIAAGVSLGKASATATANATGLAGGDGIDQLTNTGSITLHDVTADADAVGVAVSLTANFTAGVALGAAATDSSTHSFTTATGIAGGGGDDAIVNSGTITANHDIGATASTTSVSISGNFSMAGAALSAALSDSSAEAVTHLAGIDAGDGNDTIDNRGAILLDGSSDANGLSISFSLAAALGVAGNVALVDADTSATTTVAGIDGGTGRNDISNTAHLGVTSRADAGAIGVGVGVELGVGGGMTIADVQAHSTATAIGIDEAGSPTAAGTHGSITNTGGIDVLADSRVSATSVALDLRGYALGKTSVDALADAYGIRSGAGASTIDNRGALGVTSYAKADGLSVAATLAGEAIADANTFADARATGIAAGDGDDVVTNAAAITLAATSESNSSSISVVLAGTSHADAKADAATTATAIDGGVGNDQLASNANLTIDASSSTSAHGLAITVAGTNGSDVTNTPVSQATAMTGGDGNDGVLLTGGTVRVSAESTAAVTSSTWTVAGTSSSRAGVEATATSLAMDGGSGDDTLVQKATSLHIESTASANATSSSWTFAGVSGSDAALDAQARATGLDGGDGNDMLSNETAFTAAAHAFLNADGGGNTVFGNASTSTDIGAGATTTGLSGGAGNDQLQNLAALTLSAESAVDSTRVSFSFAGGADIDELLKSKATVVGLDGGSGDDQIINAGAITATATASATTNGSASTSLGGGAAAAGKATAEAIATGIDGGDGADVIDNRAALMVNAAIDPHANNSSSAGVFFGAGTVEGYVEGTLAATGIEGGNGANNVLNSAAITVTAATSADSVAFTYANGSDFSFGTGGDGNGYSEADIDANAVGIHAGNGNNTVTNSGAIQVHMEGVVASAYTDPNGGSTSGDGLGNVESIVNAWGRGIELGDGNNVVTSSGTIDLTVNPVARGQSDVDGTASDNANSQIDTYSFAEAKGIVAGLGDNHITSSAAIHVTAAPISEGFADVDAGGTLGGSTGRVNNYSTAHAYGIQVSDGNSSIDNNAPLSVIAASNARAFNNDRNVNADGHGSGDANAYVYSQSMSEAYGIRTGSGINSSNGSFTIRNTSNIDVSANALASGGYDVSPGNLDSGHADSATALYAEGRATGIWTGGTVDITNKGNITVTATPQVSVAHAHGDGGPYRFMETMGIAYGIDTAHGDGAQTVVNDGSIIVRASGTAYAANDCCEFDPTSQRIGGAPNAIGVTMQGAGPKSLVNNGTIDVSATFNGGYVGGDVTQAVFANAVQISGDGVSVVNNGTISARRNWLIVGFNGYAIYMGSNHGQDVSLSLGRQSVTTGDVFMYGGNYTLTLDGNPVLNGNLDVAAGHDFNLVLNNDGSFSHALPAVTNLTKNNAGTYSLPTLNTVRGMTLNQGTVQLASNYSFSPTGLLRVGVHGDGSGGGLASTGTVNLDGTLQVASDADLYTDGTRYHVVAANAFAAGSAFDAIELPAETTLLSFTTERSATAFDVVVHAASFASVATSANQTAVARSLDAAASDAADGMRQQLVLIQHLSAADLPRAYDSLSPTAHDLGTAAALANFGQYDDVLWGRLFDPALNASGAAGVGGVARALDARESLEPTPEFGLWMRGFQRRVTQDPSDTFTGYQYRQGGFALGYDRLFGDYTVGASMGTVKNHMDADDDAGQGHANSSLFSLYGGYSHNGTYLDGVVSYGNNHYGLSRDIVVGTAMTAATSSHEGHAFSASLNGGMNYAAGKWNLGPFSSLQYIRSREAAFGESGGPLALEVGARNTDSLVSSLGMRVGRPIGYGRGEWIPELDVAWQHDFTGDRTVSATYAGVPGNSFAVDGLPAQRDGAVAGVGVSYHAGGFVARLSYRGEYRDGFNAHGLFGGLQYVF